MKKLLLYITIICVCNVEAQQSTLQPVSGNWTSLTKLGKFDSNDNQQSNADTDFVGNVDHASVSNNVPEVFVRSGFYLNGTVHLEIINKSKAKSVTFEANIMATEVSNRIKMKNTVTLTGNLHETVIIETGNLFAIELSIPTTQSSQKDSLYFTDGPWGVDYLEDYATIDNLNVENALVEYEDNLYEVERQPSVSGVVKGNVNLFRHLQPRDQTLNVTDFNSIQFKVANNEAIEIILMPENLTDWNNRLRYTIPANESETFYSISFNDFVNVSGITEPITNIKTVVFSVIGDYAIYKPFSIKINKLAFGTAESLSIEKSPEVNKSLSNFPNPFKSKTTIKLPEITQFVSIKVIDVMGRTIDNQRIKSEANGIYAVYHSEKLSTGIYKYILKGDSNKNYLGTFVIE
ncbi:hypothetical protein [Algibacter sp.]|uniref:hypothetical protein n=1 Tax=Algibacter sp. TaxID=1872428 RepID=UPI003C7891F3